VLVSCSQGNLLDDTELIDVLAVTKQTASDVTEKLANASETNKKINEACEEYRPVAHRATLIYFLIAEFSVVNCMYQTSLAQVRSISVEILIRSRKLRVTTCQTSLGQVHPNLLQRCSISLFPEGTQARSSSC
jgi:dynein heavy chain